MPLNNKFCPKCEQIHEYFYSWSEAENIKCKNEECDYQGAMETRFTSEHNALVSYSTSSVSTYQAAGQEFRQLLGAIKKGVGNAAGSQFNCAD